MENTETQKKKLRIYTSDIKTADTSKCILRYIVPFTFDSEGKTGKYNDIVNALKKDSDASCMTGRILKMKRIKKL